MGNSVTPGKRTFWRPFQLFYIERPDSYYWLIIAIGGGLIFPFIAQWIATASFCGAWKSLLGSGTLYSFDLAFLASTLGLYVESNDSKFSHYRVGVIITSVIVMILSTAFLTSLYVNTNSPLVACQLIFLLLTISLAIYSWGVSRFPKWPDENDDASNDALENRKRKELANMRAKSTPDNIDLGGK